MTDARPPLRAEGWCSRTATRLAVPVLAACLFGACAGDGGEEADTDQAALGRLEPGPMRTVNVTPAKVEAGRGHFATCAGCHGADGTGILGTAPRLNSTSFLEAASDAMLIRTITHGREGTTMVGWGETYSDRQIEELVAYIRSFQETEPADLDERPLEGDLEEGGQLFADICAMCHGRSGGGYGETAPGPAIGRRSFLDGVTDGYLRQMVRHGKDQTAMRGFLGPRTSVANLEDEQIDSIIAYLRDSAW